MPHRIAGCGGSEQFPSDQARFLPEPPAIICYIHPLGVQYSRCSLVHSPATALHTEAQLSSSHCAMAPAPVSAALLLLAASAAAAQQDTLSSGSFSFNFSTTIRGSKLEQPARLAVIAHLNSTVQSRQGDPLKLGALLLESIRFNQTEVCSPRPSSPALYRLQALTQLVTAPSAAAPPSACTVCGAGESPCGQVAHALLQAQAVLRSFGEAVAAVNSTSQDAYKNYTQLGRAAAYATLLADSSATGSMNERMNGTLRPPTVRRSDILRFPGAQQRLQPHTCSKCSPAACSTSPVSHLFLPLRGVRCVRQYHPVSQSWP